MKGAVAVYCIAIAIPTALNNLLCSFLLKHCERVLSRRRARAGRIHAVRGCIRGWDDQPYQVLLLEDDNGKQYRLSPGQIELRVCSADLWRRSPDLANLFALRQRVEVFGYVREVGGPSQAERLPRQTALVKAIAPDESGVVRVYAA
jgi:hypothetical protein